MSKKKRSFQDIPLTNGQVLEVELFYEIGGMNYFTSKVRDRGYYLIVTPVQKSLSSDGKYSTKVTTAFTGVVKKLKGVTRYSEKSFNSFEVSQEDKDELINWVLEKNNLTIK